jgi:hypothetical protein
MEISNIIRDWFIIEHNGEKIVGHWRFTEDVILSIMHNANNDNWCTLKTFHIFLNIQFNWTLEKKLCECEYWEFQFVIIFITMIEDIN